MAPQGRHICFPASRFIGKTKRPSKPLLDVGFFQDFLLVLGQLALTHHLFQLRLDFSHGREGHRTSIVYLNDVPAKLGLYRCCAQFAFFIFSTA